MARELASRPVGPTPDAMVMSLISYFVGLPLPKNDTRATCDVVVEEGVLTGTIASQPTSHDAKRKDRSMA